MARIAGELVINRPVDEVFDFVADERNEPRYNPRIRRAEKLSPGPIGRGTRFRAEAVSLGRTVGMTSEYTAYEQANWAGLKRFLEGQATLVGNPETERDLRQAQAMRSVR